MSLPLIIGDTINLVLACIALAIAAQILRPDRQHKKSRRKRKVVSTERGPPWLSIVGLAGFALLFAVVGWLGWAEPNAVWTRLGAPAAHGFSVGTLGVCGALFFGGTSLHGIMVRMGRRQGSG